jgi:transporter family-2 protein
MLAMLLGFSGGLIIVTSKSLNNAAANRLGLFPGSLINYVTGSITALILVLIFQNGALGFTNFINVPWYFYLSGLFGLLAMILSNATLHRLPVLHSTTMIVASQMITALVIDYSLFQQFSLLKTVGATVVLVALWWDQKILKAAC